MRNADEEADVQEGVSGTLCSRKGYDPIWEGWIHLFATLLCRHQDNAQLNNWIGANDLEGMGSGSLSAGPYRAGLAKQTPGEQPSYHLTCTERR